MWHVNFLRWNGSFDFFWDFLFYYRRFFLKTQVSNSLVHQNQPGSPTTIYTDTQPSLLFDVISWVMSQTSTLFSTVLLRLQSLLVYYSNLFVLNLHKHRKHLTQTPQVINYPWRMIKNPSKTRHYTLSQPHMGSSGNTNLHYTQSVQWTKTYPRLLQLHIKKRITNRKVEW